MSKIFRRVSEFFKTRNHVGQDKAGNRYFTRTEEIDGIMKEKRWVVFKGVEDDPTSIPVEWICWLNGQRKKAPTPEEMIELEARRELVRQNIALRKKEEEERRAREGGSRKVSSTGKVGGPDLKSFIQQFPSDSKGLKLKEESKATDRARKRDREPENAEEDPLPSSSEPSGSGSTYRPGTWQPPT